MACSDFINGDSFVLARQQCVQRDHYSWKLNGIARESDTLEHSKPNKSVAMPLIVLLTLATMLFHIFSSHLMP